MIKPNEITDKIDMRSILIYFSLTSMSWEDLYEKIRRKESVKEEDMRKVFAEHNVEKRKFITIIDENYPDEWKYSTKPPFVIEIIN